ncbi:MAG TPA: aldolase [Nocardioidaceae bacterium]|nr:aldolase [Nocardioidaceae bacterium]
MEMLRQPVHTVYVPADRFGAGTVTTYGEQALAAMDEHAATAAAMAEAAGIPVDDDLLARVRDKLVREPVEDLRVDAEDGYGHRPDDEEDAAVRAAARTLAREHPPFFGLRFKSLEPATRGRGLRSLELFVAELVEAAGSPAVADGMRLTLPKVTDVEQAQILSAACVQLESTHGLAPLRVELQVETPESIMDADGAVPLPAMVAALHGRCLGLHYGTYDYSASLAIAAAYQSMEHPAADHAKAIMQVVAARCGGLQLSDGSTNVLPVGDHAAAHAAWRLHARLVRRSLERGFYQGWDLHPAQLVTRYLATYSFYRSGLSEASARLSAYDGKRESGYLDEPATAAALAGFLLRGLGCGALDDTETGVGAERLEELARRG